MKCLRVRLAALLVAVAALVVGTSSAWAVGFENGLDPFDNFLAGVRAAETDAGKQAAIDAIRAKLADPKIKSRSQNIAAFTAGLKSASKIYGSPQAVADVVGGGVLIDSVLAPMGIQLGLSEAKAQSTLVAHPSVGIVLALNKIVTAYTKSQNVQKHPDVFQRLKSMSKFAKKFDAFYNKHK